MRISGDEGVPGATVSLGHFVEQFLCVAEGAAFSIGFDGAVEEEGGWVWGESEEVGLDLAGLDDSAAVGGACAEEVGVEVVGEGCWEGEEGGRGFSDATCFQVREDFCDR